MDEVLLERRPKLRAPILICAFRGWNDAAQSASTALEFIADQWDAERFGAIDADPFLDFQVTRPTVRLRDGRTREIEWPEFTLSAARVHGTERDAVLLLGAEPNLRWRTFSQTVVELARELGVEIVVSLGALLADVPHTRAVRITGIAGDQRLVERLGFSQVRYEGPTGIVGVLHDACNRAGLPCASLWAPVPHYVAAVPNPKGALALVRALEGLLEVALDASDLEEASADYERRLDEGVAADPEVRSMVERLEQQIDEEEEEPPFPDVPSGDSIAREFQRFLRQRGQEEG